MIQRRDIQRHFARGAVSGVVALACWGLTLAALAEWQAPEDLRATVNALAEDQRAFITSGEVLEFIPERQLEHELATREADSLRALIDDLMALAAEMAYDPARDMGAVPLNLSSRRFNAYTLPTPAPLREMQRAPGPFSVHRYLFPLSGVPTFGGARVAIWPEDLVAGAVDVAIIGVPSNMSSGRRDAASAPNEMRALNTIAAPDERSLLRPLEVLNVVDYGDFSVDSLSVERSVAHVATMVAETAATGAVPMLVGGDTSMLYPGVRGVAEARGAASFGLLHISAHPDARSDGDHTLSDRQALYRLLDENVVRGADTVQLGLRGADLDVATLRWLRDQGVRYHTMVEVRERGIEAVLKRVLREVERGPEAFFVSIDVSAIEPAEMAAAGRLAANGLRVGEVTQAVRQVCAARQVVGFEITDLAPMMDSSRLSVTHANAVLNACLNGMAVRHAGLDPDYVHPLALDHGQR